MLLLFTFFERNPMDEAVSGIIGIKRNLTLEQEKKPYVREIMEMKKNYSNSFDSYQSTS